MKGQYMENGNPWRGLEAYKDGEVLYGRDEDIRNLSQRVITDVDTVLYGRSGIGKSSLINAGIIPSARRNGFIPMSIKLVHEGSSERGEDFIPYVKQIRNAIESAGVDIQAVSEPASGEELVWELFHRNKFYNSEGERTRLLVIFDQFEEIFTLQQHADSRQLFFAQLADMLNGIKPASLTKDGEINNVSTSEVGQVVLTDTDEINLDDLNLDTEISPDEYVYDNEIHFIFTLREDFLSDFEYFTSAIPSLKQHRYGLRPINEEQAADIIMRPRMGLVSKDVAKQIIEKVTERTDFELDGIPEIEVDSAVLSLYLTHLYEGKEGDTITAQQVEAQGNKIIKDFYLECIKGIDNRKVEYLEDTLINENGRRDNKSESIISREVGSDVIKKLVEEKKLLRLFPYAGEMRIEFIHDILCSVVKERKEQREQLKQRQRDHRRFKVTIMGAVAILLIAFSVFGYWYWQRRWNHVSYYAKIDYVNGWPKGVGDELSQEQRARTPLYYKLTHRGNIDHNTSIEVMSSNPKLPKTLRLLRYEVCENDSDVMGNAYNDLLSKVKYVRFVEGENKRVDKEIIEDENHKILFIISYFYLNRQNAWAQFLHENGTSLKIRDNGIDRFKISWDSIADNTFMVSSLRFYDKEGVCRPVSGGEEGVCGFLLRHPSKSQTVCYHLDNLGLPVQSKTYNAISTYYNRDTIDVMYYKETTVEKLSNKAYNENGFTRCISIGNIDSLYKKDDNISHAWVKKRTDNRGNVTMQEAYGIFPANMPHIVLYDYDKTSGYVKMEKKLDKNKHPFGLTPKDIYMKLWNYDKKGRLVFELHKSKSGEEAYKYRAQYTDVLEKRETTCLYPVPTHVLRIDSVLGKDKKSISFFGENNKMINQKLPVGKIEVHDSILCHRAVYVINGDTTTSYYYIFSDSANAEVPAPEKIVMGYKAESYYQRIETKDENDNILTLQLKNIDGSIIKSMKYIVQDGEQIGRGAMGVDGGFVRCPDWEEDGYGYYKFFLTRDFVGNIVGLRSFDEFNNYSVFYDITIKKYQSIKYIQRKAGTCYLVDIGGERALLNRDYCQYEQRTDETVSLTEIPFLHILSTKSPLYNKLKDNDRLIRVGKWHYGMSMSVLESEWSKIGKGESLIRIDVLRPSVAEKKLKRYHIDLQMKDCILEAEFHYLRLSPDEEKNWKRDYYMY